MQRLPWLTLALAAAALAGGCGGNSSSASSSTASTAGATTPSSISKASTRSRIGELIVRACKARIQNEPALTTSQKRTLEPICEQAANGGKPAREVARKVCIEIVKRSALAGSPATAARKQALAACQKAK
jgi:hypothetical protein